MNTLKKLNPLLAAAFLAALSPLLLSSCQAPQTEAAAPASYWEDMYRRLGDLDSFTLDGKIQVSVSGKTFSTDFTFSGDDDEYTLSIDSPLPLGGTLASVTASENSFKANIAGMTYETGLAEKLLSKITGISIPVQKLREVLLGMPEGENVTEADRIVSSTFMNCKINYAESTMLGGYALPSAITISGYGASGQIQLESFSAN